MSGINLKTRIYLEDTDAGGIVYNASYMRFFERARTETLRAAGFQQSVTFERDLSFVLHTLNMRFVAPAYLDDELTLTCDLTEARGASLTFSQEALNAETGQLHCRADAVVACIRLSTKRPCRVPGDLLAVLSA